MLATRRQDVGAPLVLEIDLSHYFRDCVSEFDNLNVVRMNCVAVQDGTVAK